MIGPGESYCGACGKLTVQLTLMPEQPILVASLPKTHNRPVKLINDGDYDLQVEVRPTANHPWLHHEPSSIRVPARSDAEIRFLLDGSSLPENLRIERLSYHLFFDGNPASAKPLVVTVKSGPKPSAAPVIFGELQEGSIQDRMITLRNDGGLPFGIRSVEPVGSKQLRLGELILPAKVEAGARMQIPVVWDTNVDAGDEDLGQAGFLFVFAHGEDLFVPARASLFRYRLEPVPGRIRLEGSAKTIPRQGVTLRNLGTIDVEITGIRGSASWIRVLGPTLPKISIAPEPGKEPTVGPSFTVECDLRELQPGRHQAKILIETADSELENPEVDVELEVHAVKEYHDYVGIDFGTTNSVVAVLNQDEQAELIRVEHEGGKTPLIPSLLYFHPDGSTRIGYEAQKEANVYPERIVRSIKRVMGYAEEIQIGDESFRPEDIAALILGHLVREAEAHLLALNNHHFDVQRAIVTVPSNFFALQIKAILNACEKAGIRTERESAERAASLLKKQTGTEINSTIILDEPSAAAVAFLNYLHNSNQFRDLVAEKINSGKGLHLLVYDHGGGTLDISVARVEPGIGGIGLRFLATPGDNTLGGDFFDILLMRDLLADAKAEVPEFDMSLINSNHLEIQRRREAEGWSEPEWSNVVRARQEWKATAEQLKINLAQGSTEEARAILNSEALCWFEKGELIKETKPMELSLLQEEMAQRLELPIDQGIRLIELSLEQADIAATDVDFVLHAGRQSLLELVQKKVAAAFPELPPERLVLDEEKLLKTCVAQGAARFGLMRDRPGTLTIIQERRLPHAYGIDRVSPFGDREFEEIISRGESYPVVKERMFDALPPTGRLNLKVYQNSGSRKRFVDNREICGVGQISHEFDPTATEEIRLRLEVDENRDLLVHIDDQTIVLEPPRPSAELDWMG